tara:strand:+ start:494 stop:1066 length:573 start_codon:yes stop_codon:yes gene_type:complete
MRKIAVFISGEGSNAAKMLRNFSERDGIEVALVYSSKPNKNLKALCEQLGVVFHYSLWNETEKINLLDLCIKLSIDWVVLAGFLKLIPESFLAHFPNKIINIHPALLPKFGGKGMYGMHVHIAVIQAEEVESGITIHYVNGAYDEGQIIRQFRVSISDNETSETLSTKVRVLEHKYFSDTVAELVISAKN